MIVVFVTVSKVIEARKIAKSVVSENLVACVNIVPNVESMYRWQGKIETSSEVLLLMKTERRLFSALEKRVKQLHSYSVPEIIALPIVKAHVPYSKWIKESVKG